MKFAHLADVHIGAWRDPRMKMLPDEAFSKAIDTALHENVDFVLIAGDLFNTALPSIEHVKKTIKVLQRCKEADVPVYLIPGSHDYSVSGKSMIDVLVEAGLASNVFKGTVVDKRLRLELTKDEKTGAVLTGILGKKGMLDKELYEDLDREFLKEQLKGKKNKVFLFHTSIDMLKGDELQQMESYSLKLLPEGFDYYAGGHVHILSDVKMGLQAIATYPGPVFPANFYELEKLGCGSMIIYEDGDITRKPLAVKEIEKVSVDIDGLSAVEAQGRVAQKTDEVEDVGDKIILIRVKGTLSSGRVGNIKYKEIFEGLYEKGAYMVMRNTSGVTSIRSDDEFSATSSAKEIEEEIFRQYSGKITIEGWDEIDTAKRLLQTLSIEKNEGETNNDYHERILQEAKQVLGLD